MSTTAHDESSHVIAFDRPATEWVEALPLGDGRRGAMVYGRPDRELIRINDTTGWSGGPGSERAGDLPDAARSQVAIAAARRAVEAGDWRAADRALQDIQHGYPQSFLPIADLTIGITRAGRRSEELSGYRRRLDLRTAVHETTFELDGAQVRMTTRVSRPHGVVLVVVESDAPIDLELDLTSPLRLIDDRRDTEGIDLLLRFPSDVAPDKSAVAEPIRYDDGAQSALEGSVVLRWTHDGHAAAPTDGGAVRADGVTRAAVALTTETTATGAGRPLVGTAETTRLLAERRVRRALADGADAVAMAQTADHRGLYERCTLEAGTSPVAGQVIDARLDAAFASPAGAASSDPGLLALLFNFGRYLLISSSREGGLPANLQGIWNDLMQPPWSSDYTTNINLEMNYWLAEQTDLPECLPPLFAYIEALAESGAETASRVFGAPGWVAFHCSDAWAYTQSVGDGTHDPSWAYWPMAGPWLLQHLRERLRFGGGDDVARRAWPLVRSSAEFHLHQLVELPDGALGASPATSPENHFTAPDGTRGATAWGATMDDALLRALFGFVGELAERLGIEDDEVVRAAASARERIALPRIGPDGLVQEWGDAELVPDPDHRHTAHLVFVHPLDERLSPELADAVGRSLDGRGDASTGWALVWKAAMRARLRQPERVSALLKHLLRDARENLGPFVGGLYPNLLAAHPPFQVDANLGFVAAIGECLLQSHHEVIDLLPALPVELANGTVTGLIARPGVAVDLEWKDGALVAARLTARDSAAGTRSIRWNDVVIERDLSAGRTVSLGPREFAGDDSTGSRTERTTQKGTRIA